MAEEDALEEKDEKEDKEEKEEKDVREEKEDKEEKEEKSGDLKLGTAEAKPPGNKKLILIIIAAVSLLIAVIGAVLIIIFTAGDSQSVIRGTEEEAAFVEQYNRRMQITLKPVAIPIYSDPFTSTVNLKNGYNYIHLVIRAVLIDQTAVDFLEARTPLIDDFIVTLLKNKLPQDIRTRTGLDTLKLELMTEFNKLFPQEFIEQSESKDRMPVKDVLFIEYFIQ